MAIVKVKVIDKETLQLEEDANKGDIINLNDVLLIDTSSIESLIEKEKNNILEKRIKEANEKLTLELDGKNKDQLRKQEIAYKDEIQKKIDEYNTLMHEFSKYKSNVEANLEKEKTNVEITKDREINNLKLQNATLLNQKDTQISSLNNEIKLLKENLKVEAERVTLTITSQKDKEINLLEKQIEELKHQIKDSSLQKELAIVEAKKIEEEKYKKLEEEKRNIETKYQQLSLQKSSLNVKKLGEELERYCNEEYQAAAISGFTNCQWYKDNTAIKNEDDIKGTKADFIFKVFSDSSYSNESLLSSVCLEMKNESNVSSIKKKNSDHYKKLDEDRNKKGCEYALLVSELEWDTPNDSPIKKVNEYEKMYIVRPQYMITFLSIIYTLANKFKDLLITSNKEKLELKEANELVEEFNKLKNTYLDKPLESLTKSINTLKDNNEQILTYARKNDEEISKIIDDKLKAIREKIERFDIKKLSRKLDKLENN